MIRIKTLDYQYLEEASEGEPIYGTLSKYVNSEWQNFFVYVWPGKEVEYRESQTDDPKTEYKKFLSCTVELAKTLDDLEQGQLLGKENHVTVILYY